MKPKPKKVPVRIALDWAFLVQMSATVTNDKSRLSLVVNKVGGLWQCVAFETALSVDTLEGVFNEHTHKIVGGYVTQLEAYDAAEGFAGAWLKGYKATQANPCDCTELKLVNPLDGSNTNDDLNADVMAGIRKLARRRKLRATP